MRRPDIFSALARLPGQRRRLLPEAMLTLAWSSLLVACLPFRSVMRLAGAPPRRTSPAAAATIVLDTVWAVEACGRRVPWRAVCFQQGLAVHLMLRRRGVSSTLHYGVRQNASDGLKAHVWVTVGEVAVIGGEQAPRFARLVSVPAAAARS